MQKLLKFVVAGLIVLAILAYMTTYSVRFTETAVVTTFGKADKGSVKSTPGMGFRWPYPIQKVVNYDTRARMVEAQPQTLATKDESQLIVSAFLTWKVEDPLAFYQSYGKGARTQDHFREADNIIRGSLSAALSLVSQYRMDELLSPQAGASKLKELENKIKETLLSGQGAGGAGAVLQAGGIKLLSVGIYNIQMPESITISVFDAMKTRRTTIAAEAINKGKADAEAINSQGLNDARTIMAFVEQRGKTIKAQGDQEATQFLAMMASDPDLAIFLRALDFMRAGIGKQATLVWPMSAPGMGVFNPTSIMDTRQSGVPKLFPANFEPKAPTPSPDAEGKKVKP